MNQAQMKTRFTSQLLRFSLTRLEISFEDATLFRKLKLLWQLKEWGSWGKHSSQLKELCP